MPPTLDFEFYAGGIEDGILEVLKEPMKAIGVKSLGTYSGELDDAAAIEDAISQQTFQLPGVLVTYAGGENANNPKTSPVLGRPRSFRHECSFGVIVLDDNPQGERARRRGKIFKMQSVVWRELTDRRLKKVAEGEGYVIIASPFESVGDGEYLLTVDPFEPVETIVIPKLPNITAICQIFDTAFKWMSEDRTAAGTTAEEIEVEVENSWNRIPGREPAGPPGVSAEVGG
jgi:phage gp37-like protein